MSIVRWILAVVVMGAVGFTAVASLRPKPARRVTVHAAKVVRTTITHTVRGAGKLEPVRKVEVSSNITGTLIELKVGIGDLVKEGDVLGQIDTTRYQAQTEQQRAQLRAATSEVLRAQGNANHARAERERIAKLVEKGVGVRAELDQAENSVRLAEADLVSAQSRAQVARASLAEAESALSWATLKAPVGGTVLSVNHLVGERIRGSDFSEDVVLVLGSLSEVDVRLEVGEHEVVHIRPGQEATLELDALPDVTLSGAVKDSGRDAIVKNVGTENEVTTFPVWVSLANPPPQALSGMSTQVVIATETRENVLAVPIQAVAVRPAEPGAHEADAGPVPLARGRGLDKVVFVVKDGVAQRRRVTTGLTSESLVEILDGVAEGELVVDGPYRLLARELEDGKPVVLEKDTGHRGARGPS